MSWQWFRNVDGNKVLRDEVTICNTAKGMSVSCGNGAAKLDKINPGRSAKNWAQRRLARKAPGLRPGRQPHRRAEHTDTARIAVGCDLDGTWVCDVISRAGRDRILYDWIVWIFTDHIFQSAIYMSTCIESNCFLLARGADVLCFTYGWWGLWRLGHVGIGI